MAESIREPELDALVFEIGSGLYQLAAGAPPSLFDGRGLKGRIVARALEDEPLRAWSAKTHCGTALFRRMLMNESGQPR